MSKQGIIILAVALVLVASLVAISTGVNRTPAVRATIGSKQALINGATVTGGTASVEATLATAAGFNVTVVTGAAWTAMPATLPGPANSFDDYQVLIIGDPTCAVVPLSATSNAAVWAPVVMGTPGFSVNTLPGNRILIGTDPVVHRTLSGSQGDTLIRDGIAFAGALPGRTGVYFDMSCGDNGQGVATLNLLSATAAPAWSINSVPPCGGSVSLIAAPPGFAGPVPPALTSAGLQGWGCSVHESFPTFRSDWSALAVATTVSPSVCGTDTTTGAAACGEPYILVAGSGIVTTSPNISVSPTTATNPAGTNHKVTATVTTAGGAPLAGQVVTFTVSGQNNGATGTCLPPTCVTDSLGQVSFTYHDSNGCGDDTILASFVDAAGAMQQASAAKHWTCTDTPTPTNTPTATITPGGPTPTQLPYIPHETPPIITHPNCKPARLVGTIGWQAMAIPQFGVEGATGVIIGSKLYVTHGRTAPAGFDSNVTQIYNLLTNVWTNGPPPFTGYVPQPRSELVGVCALQGGSAKVFAIGGRTRPPNSNVGVVDATVEMYDTVSAVWSARAPMFTARAGLGAVTDPRTNTIFAIGGRTGDAPHTGTPLGTVEAYDPATNTWRATVLPPSSSPALAQMPVPMMDIYSTVYFEGKIYVIGGFDGTSVSNLLQIYDIDTNTWSTGAPMQTARSNLIAGVCRDKIYAIGGTTDPALQVNNLTTNEVYDPVTNVWTTALAKPTAASEMSSSAISTGEEIFAIGSGIEGHSIALHEVFTCAKTPATSTPTRTPAAGNTPTPTPAAGNTPTPTPAKPCGDVNDDGQVNPVDSNLILVYEADLIHTLPNLPSADVNGDGRVNSIDSNLILQFVAGLIPSLPC